MTDEQIRRVVRTTIDELIQNKMLISDNYKTISRVVEKKLFDFFGNKGDGNGIGYALHILLDDPYIDIVFSYYRDGKTLGQIAKDMGKGLSTVKRQRKRLVRQIYNILEENKRGI